MHEITSKKEFEEILKNESKPIIVDFFAPWCGPCKNIAPHFENLAEVYKNICFYKVNTDDENVEDLLDLLNVSSLPTFVLFKNKYEKHRFCGASKTSLEAMVYKALE